MAQRWLDVATKMAVRIPSDLFAEPGLPLPDTEYVQRAAEWRGMTTVERKKEIGAIRTAPVSNMSVLLFVLWTWEPNAELRAEIIRGFPEDCELGPRVLEMIFRHEAPDDNGRTVRNEVFKFLTKLKEQKRATLGRNEPPPSHSEFKIVDNTLEELTRLRKMNPWL